MLVSELCEAGVVKNRRIDWLLCMYRLAQSLPHISEMPSLSAPRPPPSQTT